MSNLEYLKDKPIAILGAGAIGKACAADCTLAGQEVRLYDMQPFADKTLFELERTGVEIFGIQRNLYAFERSGKAMISLITKDMAEAVKGAGIIIIGVPAVGHEKFFRELIPLLEDGQIIHLFPDNWGTLLFRKLMREMDSDKKVIVGGWSSAPYGARVKVVGGFSFPKISLGYRAITLRGAALPMTDTEDFLESAKYMRCMDAITTGNGTVAANTVIDTGLSNINPVIHVPGTVLGVSTMENWGKILGSFDNRDYSIYSHAFCPSISEVQYTFYNEEIELAETMGVGIEKYQKDDFFHRRSVLALEYMGPGNFRVPLDQCEYDAFGTGPHSIQHRYITEDVPVGCKVYHDLAVKYGVKTPVIDSMITIAGAMIGKDYFNEGYSLEYLGIDHLDKNEMLDYLNNGVYKQK